MCWNLLDLLELCAVLNHERWPSRCEMRVGLVPALLVGQLDRRRCSTQHSRDQRGIQSWCDELVGAMLPETFVGGSAGVGPQKHLALNQTRAMMTSAGAEVAPFAPFSVDDIDGPTQDTLARRGFCWSAAGLLLVDVGAGVEAARGGLVVYLSTDEARQAPGFFPACPRGNDGPGRQTFVGGWREASLGRSWSWWW